ncbi:MAG TPA: hypothetical protein VG537_00510 [Candidatus Kapabacteria bacterium]|nr:hypothetical protein [Candidatus Kapabacteria bacterium]
MSKLPNADRAFVDIRKLTDYLLDPTHPRGRHKARMFRAALGIGRDEAEWLHERLLVAARSEEAQLVDSDEFGDRYILNFMLVGLDRNVTIRSSWIILYEETFPRFVGCYIT